MTPEIQELKRLAEAAMPSLSEMMVVEFAEFSSVRDQDGASIAQVRGGVPYFDKEVAAYIAAASPSTILALIEAVKRQGEAKDTPIWGVWVDYNLAPPGSYACLVSSFVNGEWSDPEARWMPAQGRPRLQGQIRIMPHLMPNDPLTAHKDKSDV